MQRARPTAMDDWRSFIALGVEDRRELVDGALAAIDVPDGRGNTTFEPRGLRGLSIPLAEIWAGLPARGRKR